ncbi:MAG: hypothetical protein ABIA75_11575 [Candidatus Neomarinimicrobiota bacterium]
MQRYRQKPYLYYSIQIGGDLYQLSIPLSAQVKLIYLNSLDYLAPYLNITYNI